MQRLLLALLVCAATANAQPRLSYLIPDIGTTRMGTYVEFVAPQSAVGSFGTDGLSLNNPGDAVRIMCVDPADENKVKIGPVVVSWNGRLATTHFFVLPTIVPNSDDWTRLDRRYKIPVVVEVNGVRSNIDTFYIVKPFAFGNRTADAGRILGEGTLGKRSRRGAMLVDSAILAPARYDVSIADCDPSTPGNQGYLPFTLLSVGDVLGTTGSVSSSIHADAKGVNGGPGGGGGGGGYADNPISFSGPQGTDGGNGFTGGGPGGRNNLTGGGSKKRPGAGSGEALAQNDNNAKGSASLNGMPGGESHVGLFENAGGGTGHPFGQSGSGCNGNSSCQNNQGGYGGGSGLENDQRGGGGGFGTAGGSETGRPNGGRIVGNTCLVPLAGGSGGASGNPSGVGVEASAGGGGGGAVAIHARRIANVDVYAYGDVISPSGNRNNGGGGSGGGIILGSRLDNTGFGPFSAQPYPNDQFTTVLQGGVGRRRYDARGPFTEAYAGPGMDTLTATLRDVTLVGYGNNSDVQLYIKPERGPWRAGPLVSGYFTTWFQPYTLPDADTLYFIVAAQKVNNPASAQYGQDPQWVLSQSGSNLLRIFGPPVIDAPRVVDLDTHACPNTPVRATFTVHNRGESPLVIDAPSFVLNNGFTLVQPTSFPDTVLAFDSAQYIVEFLPLVGQNGTITDTLVLPNNDTVRARDPYRIAVTVSVQKSELSFVFRGIPTDTVDFGRICIGRPYNEDVTMRNTGSVPITLTGARSLDPAVVFATATLPWTLPLNGVRNTRLTCTARLRGVAVALVIIESADCPVPDTLYVHYEGIEPDLASIGSGQFGVVRVGESRQVLIELLNKGNGDLHIASLPTVLPPFSIVAAAPAPPTTLSPGERMIVTVQYDPAVAGDHTADLEFKADTTTGQCPDSVTVVVSGRAIGSTFTLSRPSLNFGDVSRCDSSTLTFTVGNFGSGQDTLYYPSILNGPDASTFAVVQEPTQDTVLGPGDVARYAVTVYSAPTDGVKTALLTIRTSSAVTPRLDIPISSNQVPLSLTGPTFIDAGPVAIGSSVTVQATYRNTSVAAMNIVAVRSTNAAFTVTPQTITLAPAAQQTFDITFTPTSGGFNSTTLCFVIDAPCNDSLCVDAQGVATSGTLSAPVAISFGSVPQCTSKRDTLAYFNTGTAALTLVGPTLVGPNTNAFTMVNAAAVTNRVLQPGERADLIVEFDPQALNDGIKEAEIVMSAIVDGTPREVRTRLVGHRETALPGAPNEIIFGAIDVGTTSTQRLTLLNTTTVPIRITQVRMKGTSGGAILAQAITPITLDPDDSFEVLVLFTPPAQADYVDSIEIVFDQPCSDIRVVPVRGIGKLNVQITLLLPELTVDPATDGLALPVRAVITQGAGTVQNAEFRTTIRYDGGTFVAQRLSRGTIERNEIIGGIAYLGIVVPNVSIDTDTSTLVEVIGQATLGTVDSTELAFESAVITSPQTTPLVRRDDGYLLLEICRDGDDRLLQRTGSLAMIADPNPAHGHTTITTTAFERGAHSIEIISLTGERVYHESWTRTISDGAHRIDLTTSELPSGLYHVVLTTPSRRRMMPLQIVH